jgi:hypothetical protein
MYPPGLAPEQTLELESLNGEGATQIRIEVFATKRLRGLRHAGAPRVCSESEEFFNASRGLQWSGWAEEQLSELRRREAHVRAAHAMARRLQTVVPVGWDNRSVTVEPLFRRFAMYFSEPSLSPKAALECAFLSLLEQLPDDIAEDTTEPWPPRRHSEDPLFADPHVEQVGNAFRLWYGKAEDPVLELDQISFEELGL